MIQSDMFYKIPANGPQCIYLFIYLLKYLSMAERKAQANVFLDLTAYER